MTQDQNQLLVVDALVVREPGKARSVTKGPAHVKVLLDIVSKLCADVLAKAFPSSNSGMKMSDHPWRLFKDFSNTEFDSMFFQSSEIARTNPRNRGDR